MVKLVASAALRYANKDLRAGDKFDASETDAFVLKGTGKAEDASLQENSTASVEQPRKKRAYRRRDMLAERPGDRD